MSDHTWLEPKSSETVRGILSSLRTRLERTYGERLRGLYLYGSYARGEARPGSDLDVLVVLDRIDSYWQEILRTSHDTADLSLEHDLTVSTVFTTENHWQSPASPFLRNVRDEGQAA
ncbi:MAG: nucleotidyltransferase domain-containing protein [Gemmatimonadota bacterium]